MGMGNTLGGSQTKGPGSQQNGGGQRWQGLPGPQDTSKPPGYWQSGPMPTDASSGDSGAVSNAMAIGAPSQVDPRMLASQAGGARMQAPNKMGGNPAFMQVLQSLLQRRG